MIIDFTFVIVSGQKDLIKLPSVISPSLAASFIYSSAYFIWHSSIVYQQFYFSLNGRQNKTSNWESQSKASNSQAIMRITQFYKHMKSQL